MVLALIIFNQARPFELQFTIIHNKKVNNVKRLCLFVSLGAKHSYGLLLQLLIFKMTFQILISGLFETILVVHASLRQISVFPLPRTEFTKYVVLHILTVNIQFILF